MSVCPLCKGANTESYFRDKFRDYLVCRDCYLVHVPERFHLSDEEEKTRYDLHENDPGDLRYRAFLGRLFNPVKAYIAKGSSGLDFGCGPGPTLSVMLQEAGYVIDTYDKFYAPHFEVFQNRYDFITATEVAEHLSDPRFELERLFHLIKENGLLGVMTKLATNRPVFEKWHYIRDPTHVSFFSKATFEWLGDLWKARVEFIGNDVILIHKDS
jgi:hypothetical protein